MILIFADWKLSPHRGASLGHQYDNLTSELIVQGNLPEGWEWDVLVSAGGNGDTWHLTPGDGQASIALTEDNLSVEGEYYLQLRGIKGELVRHTNIVTAHNFRSLSGAGQWPTLPTEWIQAEKDIKELNAHPPVPGEDGYWQLWDLSTHSYQPSQLVVPGLSVQAGTVTTLAPDAPATVEVVGDGPGYKINFGTPQGKPGTDGAPGKDGAPGRDGTDGAPGKDGQTPTISVGSVATLDPGQEATAEITGQTPNLTLNLGIPQGQPGQDGVQINDEAVNTTEAWSSKKILDTLCPPFTETGNPITCNPVEDYPLDVTVTMDPIQEGTGDPSPDNVRPISGRDEVTVTRCGKNLLDFSKIVFDPIDVESGRVSVDYEHETITIRAGENNVGYAQPLSDVVGKIPAGTYIINAAVSNPNADKHIYFLDTQKVMTFGQPTNLTDRDIASTFSWYNKVGSDTPNTISNIVFSVGSTPTAYEPYQGDTYTFTLPETIYGGEVDAVSGVGSKEFVLHHLTGEEIVSKYSPSSYSNRFFIDLEHAFTLAYTPICSSFVYYNTYDMPVNTFILERRGSADRTRFVLQLSADYTETEQVKSYLATQYAAGTPVTGCYKLATPEPFQATGNQPILALAGENTVYTDGDSVSVSGRKDPTLELQSIQAMKAQLATMLGSAEEVS